MKVVYIAGCMRSGTTLLCQLLGHTTDSLDVGELAGFWTHAARGVVCSCGVPIAQCELWGAAIGAAGIRSSDLAETGATLSGYLRTRNFFAVRRASHRGEVPAAVQTALDRTNALVGAALEITGRETVVDSSKTLAGLMVHILSGNTPIDVIHLVRDPRAVASSEARSARKPSDSPVAAPPGASPTRSVLRWHASNLALIAGLRRLDLPASRIRYEDLARHPTEMLTTLADRLDLKTQERHSLESHIPVGNPSRLKFDANVVLDERWKEELTRFQQYAIAAASFPTMKLLRPTLKPELG